MNNQLYFAGLVTHNTSKYLNKHLVHEPFELLVKNLGIESSCVQFEDHYSKGDFTFFDVLNQLRQVMVLLITQCNIYLKIFYNVSNYYKINLLKIFFDIFYLTSKRLLLIFFATFSIKYKNILELLVYRQSNISYSHISLLTIGLESGKPWVLIVEDDIEFECIEDVQLGLEIALHTFALDKEIIMINLSESFSLNELGLEGFCAEVPLLNSLSKFSVYTINYPATNTVCATIYRSESIRDLILQLNQMNPFSLIPIDIKMNLALHRLVKSSVVKSSAYSTMIPGLFVQGSLVDE
jgi:hypothetical protein